MKKNLIYVGVDVDDNAFHFAGVSCEGEVLFKNKKALPSAGSLLKEIKVWCKFKT